MSINLKKFNIFYKVLFIAIVAIFLFIYLIFEEFKKIKTTNNSLKFIEFVKYTSNEFFHHAFKDKRIKKIKRSEAFISYDEKFKDSGFILFSGYDDKKGFPSTKLFSLSKREIIYEWSPPIDEINKKTPTYTSEYNLKKNYRMQHPLLTDKGELIFGSGEGPIAKIDHCNKLVWAIDRHFHHSIEYYKNNQIVVPIVINEKNYEIPILDHGYAIVDISNGKILSETSVTEILNENKYIGLLYGVGEFEYDRIHLNDAEIIKFTDKYFSEGDVMLSSKHLSTVFVYRPSNRKIIWLKTGPWLNQHDIDYIGNGKFSIYGNDTFRYNMVDTYDVFYSSNNIYIYDFPNDKISKLYLENMQNIRTPTQGLHKILSNDDVFIEETDNFILHRIGKNKKRWDFVNLVDKNKVGSIHWSRYLDANIDLGWLNNLNCD